MSPFIKATNLSISFPILGQNRNLRKKLIGLPAKVGARLGKTDDSKTVVVEALKSINLNFEDGTRVGLIGHNGAGKTTLLRTLAGVYSPTSGDLAVHGRISSLFNTMLGMDLEDSGLENIRTIGLYLGLSVREIEEKIPEIIEFAEIGDFAQLPLRTFSSGMLTRLSFALVTSIEPEILLLDEGIGTGDAHFENRAKKRLESFYQKTKILVLATHSESLMYELCDTAILLSKGEIVMQGTAHETWDFYRELVAKDNPD